MNIARHGDLGITPINKLPDNLKEVGKSSFVLAYGEATGHRHLLTGDFVALRDKEDTLFLNILKPAKLDHQEHKEITLMPGYYQIHNEREYDYFTEEINRVLD